MSVIKKIKKHKRYRPQNTEEPKEIYLSDEDRITYIYEKDLKGTYKKVVNVSYQIFINKKWITIVRYDSSHGILHRHLKISLDNPIEIYSTTGVKKKGNNHTWLTWAIENTKEYYLGYKKGFIKRSKT